MKINAEFGLGHEEGDFGKILFKPSTYSGGVTP